MTDFKSKYVGGVKLYLYLLKNGTDNKTLYRKSTNELLLKQMEEEKQEAKLEALIQEVAKQPINVNLNEIMTKRKPKVKV